MSALQSTVIPKQTALHTQTLLLTPRIMIRPYTPAKRPQRERHWQQRLTHLFAKQRY